MEARVLEGRVDGTSPSVDAEADEVHLVAGKRLDGGSIVIVVGRDEHVLRVHGDSKLPVQGALQRRGQRVEHTG